MNVRMSVLGLYMQWDLNVCSLYLTYAKHAVGTQGSPVSFVTTVRYGSPVFKPR
jgi:hypothetical protein